MVSTEFPATPVPRASCSSRADVAALIDAAQPVVITPEAGLGAGRLRAPCDLRRAFDGVPVTVTAAQHGGSGGKAPSANLSRRMAFADFATYVENAGERDAQPLYLSQFPLDKAPAGLGRELREASFIPESCPIVSSNLWFGPAGTVSPLHFDQNHNLLDQHYGRKHVILADPRQFHVLKPGEKNSPSEHVSSLGAVTSHFTTGPSLLEFSGFEAVLGPGDVLFVPAFWWHHVVSLDVAISVNYWWRAPISACLYPGLFRFLSSRFVYSDPSVVARMFELGPYQPGTGLCLFLADHGHAFGAAALAGALVAAFCRNALGTLGLGAPHPDTGETAGSYPDFAQAHTVVRALAAHGLVRAAQEELLQDWLELARETAADPDGHEYSPERARAIRSMIVRLDAECGTWLST